MDISRNSRSGRMFNWAMGIIETFIDKDISWRHSEQTNLCYFVRAVFFYAPGIILLQFIIYSVVIGSVFVMPIMKYGLSSSISAFGWTIGIFIAFFCFLLLVAFCTCGDFIKLIKRFFTKESPSKEKSENILMEWYKAKKQKICPIINFID